MTVGTAILEAGRVHHQPGSDDGDAFVSKFLDLVRLPASMAVRHRANFSGDSVNASRSRAPWRSVPEVLIADRRECSRRVDPDPIAQPLLDLRDELGLAILFVAHSSR